MLSVVSACVIVFTTIQTSAIAAQPPRNQVAKPLHGAMAGKMRRGRHAAALRLGCVMAAWQFLQLQMFGSFDHPRTCLRAIPCDDRSPRCTCLWNTASALLKARIDQLSVFWIPIEFAAYCEVLEGNNRKIPGKLPQRTDPSCTFAAAMLKNRD
ncbi:hypothetical protein Y032_0533g3053 [Ancylostoma ceylanicum]|uniref:Uncharacterized protein n=1 Tax=Ancylostoma ceylanicum TaxID=53326 RepID=A0A016WRD8_9BILA|nr:hypothetical protein Y032_0533g3053 [Ancylostoma ceylanicum]